ncbi:MAG: hypothetical protein AB7F98_18040 [Novosphingobium sp.]
MTRFSLKILLALAALCSAPPAAAQPAPPFAINSERVHYQSVQRCAGARAFIVPSFYLYISARNRLSTQEQPKRGKPRIFIQGLEKQALQALARNLYDDLIARLRASGARVLTYDDIRSEIANSPRKRGNSQFGLPTRSDRGSVNDFLVVAPSDEQAIDWERNAVTRPYRDLARDNFAAVIVPELTFTLPQTGDKARKAFDQGPLARRAGISVDPALMFTSGMMNGMPEDLRWCNIHVQEHTFRLAAQGIGAIEPIARDESGDSDWRALRSDYAFVADPQAVAAGVLRVGYAFNALMADALKRK